jgi:YtcA-like protein
VIELTLPPNGGLFGGRSHTQTRGMNVLDSPNRNPGPRATRHVLTLTAALLLACMLGGCSGSPSRNILGSYFPSWMVCALVGLVVALGARAALKASGLLGEVPAPLVVLLSIGCATTFALWLVWLA